ncbi:YkuS family protein [Vallitalea pronyensis]|uniref:YkuS family protein n=1 Tax=Vallitalea pronyensis TaxID=1348613 RepID=A0A8J8MGM3_9FIRM|nr:YkuS family protein [Vallitalea pronyensis]QUI21106.1 YkuS family protein [Vallitalea pronyensis]
MTIYVQEELDRLYDYLKNRGYHVINGSMANAHDIYIYASSSYRGLYNEILNNDMYNAATTNNVLMINASGKSFSDIEAIINSRKYSRLFESEGFF